MTEWLLRSVLASVLVALAALSAETVLRTHGRAQRGAWAAALAMSVGLAVIARLRPDVIPDAGILRWLFGAREVSGASGPAVFIQVPVLPAPASAHPAAAPAASAGGALDLARVMEVLDPMLLVAWLAASTGLLAAYGWAWHRTRRAASGWPQAEVDGFRVLLSDRVGPAVIGVRSPRIVLPRWVLDTPREERRMVLAHEHEHVRAGDSRWLAAGALALALMPLNPVLWWMRQRLQESIETDCDARVLEKGAERHRYLAVLLKAAAAARAGGGLAMPLALARRRLLLERRFLMITSRRPRKSLLATVPLAILAVGVVLAACELLVSPGSNGLPDPLAGTGPGDGTAASAADPGGSGRIAGVVLDPQTGEPVANAQVFVEGSGIGTLTGVDGTYSLEDLPAGEYDVSVVYPGRRTHRQPDTRVGSGTTTQLSHELSEEAIHAGTLLVGPARVELQPPTVRQEVQPTPVRGVPGQLVFTPYIVLPRITNWPEVGAAIRRGAPAAGELVVWVYVDDHGLVRNSRTVTSSGNEQLDRIAESTIRETGEFTPALNRDDAVPVWLHVPVVIEAPQ